MSQPVTTIIKSKSSKSAEKIALMEARMADMVLLMEKKDKVMEQKDKELAKMTELAKAVKEKKSKSKPDDFKAVMDGYISKQEKKVSDAEEVLRVSQQLLEEMIEVREQGSDEDMKEWVTKDGRQAPSARTAIDRDACLDLLPNGLLLRACGKDKEGKAVSVEATYDEAERCFVGKSGVIYPKLQDANKVFCEAKGVKLGNAWSDFKAISLTGAKKSIENIWKDNWLIKEDLDLWILIK